MLAVAPRDRARNTTDPWVPCVPRVTSCTASRTQLWAIAGAVAPAMAHSWGSEPYLLAVALGLGVAVALGLAVAVPVVVAVAVLLALAVALALAVGDVEGDGAGENVS